MMKVSRVGSFEFVEFALAVLDCFRNTVAERAI